MPDEEFEKWLEEYTRRQEELHDREAKTATLEIAILVLLALIFVGFAVMSCGGCA